MDQEQESIALCMMADRIERIKNDVNGNPRYRAHWMDFATLDEQRAGYCAPAWGRAQSLYWKPANAKNSSNYRDYWTITSHIGKGGLAAEIVKKLHEGRGK